MIVASGKGVPCSLVTFPVTVFCCADAAPAKKNTPVRTTNAAFLILTCTAVRVQGFGGRRRSPGRRREQNGNLCYFREGPSARVARENNGHALSSVGVNPDPVWSLVDLDVGP